MHSLRRSAASLLAVLSGGVLTAHLAGCGYQRFDFRTDGAEASGGTQLGSDTGGQSTGGSGVAASGGAGSAANGSSGGTAAGGLFSGGVGAGSGGVGASSAGGVGGAGTGASGSGATSGAGGTLGEGGATACMPLEPGCDTRPCCQDFIKRCKPGMQCPYCENSIQCLPGSACDLLTNQCLLSCGYCAGHFDICDDERRVCVECRESRDCVAGLSCVEGVCLSCRICK